MKEMNSKRKLFGDSCLAAYCYEVYNIQAAKKRVLSNTLYAFYVFFELLIDLLIVDD